MSFDWSWFKTTGLAAVQAAAHALTGAVGGTAVNAWHMDFNQDLGLALGAAFVAVLGRIISYRPPGSPPELVAGVKAPVVAPAAVGCAPGK